MLLVLLLCSQSSVGSEDQKRAYFRPKRLQDYVRPEQSLYPADNPWSEEKAALGAALFVDPILSGRRGTACVTCHEPGQAWADNVAHGIGDRGEAQALRSPTLLDVAWVPLLGWDGKFDSIEAVSLRAISAPSNMDLPLQVAVDRLSTEDSYVEQFRVAFGPGPITSDKVAQALATFERGIASTDAPFDRWVAGEDAAMSDAAKRGFVLFEGKAQCVACHSGWAFSDYSFQDVGLGTGDDRGRGWLFPNTVSLQYAFKVPTLRDVALRAPYGHDGSLPSLAAVVELYDRGGIVRPSRAAEIRPLGLTPDEKADLVAFLESLTGITAH